MKYTMFLLFILLGFLACQDDDRSLFDATMPKENIRFKPIPGGAMMYYKLPADKNIFALKIRYADACGQEVLKVGGYGSDSLVVNGFNEARKGVSASVVLVNKQNEESEAIDVTFDTEDSAPYAFFEKAEVTPYWNGFQVTYEAPRQVAGMLHVFYLGTNPLTQKEDTVLVKSMPIAKGENTLLFPLQQFREKNTVILRTEDYRGYRVKQKIWEGVESYHYGKLVPPALEFIDIRNLSIESDLDKVGMKYLFDGDTKGETQVKAQQHNRVYAFLAGPFAVGAPFIIDLKQPEVPALVRIYGRLRIKKLYLPNDGSPNTETGEHWKGLFPDKLPCDVTIYGGNDKDGDTWTELGTFFEDKNLPDQYRWSYRCTSNNFDYSLGETIEAASPAYLEILFSATGLKRYRYLKLIVDETFTMQMGWVNNPGRYVAMQELEVYVKK